MDKMFCIPNVTASLVEKKTPWEQTIELPEFETKAQFRRWISDSATRYLLYSGVEGADPTQRVNRNNPPRYLHGVVADWDAKVSDEEFTQFMTRVIDSEFPCSWVSRSYSGGIHAVWFFDDYILLHGGNATKRLLQRMQKELKLDKLCRGFDRPAFNNLHTYYNLGENWKKVSDSGIPLSALHYWQYETSRGEDFETAGIEIPLEAVKEAVDEKYPDLWDGPFVEGARGRYFWADPPGTNPTSAIVRPTGMQCFSGHQPFFTWSEILGPRFVSQFEIGRIGRCIQQYWYDGRNYFICDDAGDYIVAAKEEAYLDLQARHSLTSQRGRRENLSEAQRALFQIHTTKRVEAAVPFCYVKSRIVKHENRRYFNTARISPLAPSQESVEWGDKFPLLAEWLTTMFGEEQLKWELAWLAYAYQGALGGNPRKGQAHFLVGPPNCGKTLYNIHVLGKLFGGHMKCSEYLIGKTDFNDHLFETGFWSVDDEAGMGGEAHVQFSSRVKEFVANDSFVVNAKFKKSGRVFWRGRLSVTLNNDPVSMRLLPDLDMSTKDKLMVFSCEKYDKFTKDFKEGVLAELPFFASWLNDHEVPDEMADIRFGVKAYLCPKIHDTTKADGRYSHIAELLDIFKDSQLDESDRWEGTCSELLKILSKMTGVEILLRDVNTRKLGWAMRHLSTKGCDWLTRSDTKGSCKWVIEKTK